MTTLDQIKAIIGDQIGKPASEIGDDTPLSTLDLDSLDKVELAMSVEEHFHIDIPDEAVDEPEMGTPAGIAAYVDGQVLRERVNDHQVAGSAYRCFHCDTLISEGEAHNHSLGGILPAESPITREEVLRRGVAEGEGMALNIAHQLGWPTEDEPLGRDPTHALIEIDALSRLLDAQPPEPAVFTHSGIEGIRFHRRDADVEAVQFREIEVVNGTARAVFNHPNLPQWLLDAHAQPEGDEGALWVVRAAIPTAVDPMPESAIDVLALGGVRGGRWHVRPGQWIVFDIASGKITKLDDPEFAATYEPVDAHEPI